jgi:hypothetical protein
MWINTMLLIRKDLMKKKEKSKKDFSFNYWKDYFNNYYEKCF